MRIKPVVLLAFLCAWPALSRAQSVRTVPLTSTGMAYSASRDLLYVAVSETSPQRPRTVTTVNVRTGAIGASVTLQAEPWSLAMSADERHLYAGLADGNVVRIDLGTFARDLVISTAGTGVADPAVLEIHPFPDRSTSFVASVMQQGVGRPVLAVFDGAVMRPRTLGGEILRVSFGADSRTLWGYDGSPISFGLYRLRIQHDGLSVASRAQVGLLLSSVTKLLFREGLLFGNNGEVVDPEKLTIEGRYHSFESARARSFAVDWARRRVYFAARSGYDFYLSEFDLRTFRRVGGVATFYGNVLVPWTPELTVLCGSMLAFGGYGSDQPFITLFPLSLIQPAPEWRRPPDQPLSTGVRRIPLENTTIVHDSARGRILAATPNWASTIGNSLVPIDPVKGRVGDPVWVGPDPWQMAITDDGQYLYAGLYSGFAVQRVRLDGLRRDLRIPLFREEDFWGPLPTRVNDILPVAGRPESFVVARAYWPGDPIDIVPQGVVVFDGATPRPLTTRDRPYDATIWSVQWDQANESLYAFPNFRELRVDQRGVQVGRTTRGVADTVFSTDLMRCQYDLCFTPSAFVVDARSQEALGRLAVDVWADDFYWADFTVPDLDRGLVYYVADLGRRYLGDRRLTVEAYDVRTQERVGRLVIDDCEKPTGFLIWGEDQLAVSTSDEVILFPMSQLHRRLPGTPPTADELRPSRWVFPFIEEDYGRFTGFAVSNPGGDPIRLRLTSFSGDGDPNAVFNGRHEIRLGPRSQWARLGTEIFGPDRSAGNMWLALDGPEDSPGGFFLFQHGDGLDGAIAQKEAAKVLYFPRVSVGENRFRGRTATNQLYLVNPNGYAVRVKVTIVGQVRVPAYVPERFTIYVDLPAYGWWIEDPWYRQQHVDLVSAYVKVEVDQERGSLIGFQLIRLQDPETLIAFNALAPETRTVSFSAQLASGPAIFSNLKLINATDQPREVTLTAVADDGSPLAAPVHLTLEPGGFLEEDADTLFAFPRGRTVTGSLRVEADGPGLLGNLLFGDPRTLDFASAVNLEGETFQDAVFSHVADVPGFFTGLALYNASEEENEVTLEVHQADGRLSGRSAFTLAAGARLSRLLPELVPASAGQAGGYIRVRSSRPLVGQQLFGNTKLSHLSAVPAQVIR